jgi:hypothetical protein
MATKQITAARFSSVLSVWRASSWNGESLLERVTRLEAGQQMLLQRIEEYHLSRKKDLEEAILKAQEKTNELLNKQVQEQLRQNRMQLIGLWITIVSLVGGFFVSKALGWLK